MVGISNKPGGYSIQDIEFLEPFTVTCSNLIEAYRQIERNQFLINTLEQSVKERTRELEEANRNLEEANRHIVENAKMKLEHFACMRYAQVDFVLLKP
jgi:pyridoxal biosynthesis lyase PdxS